LKLPFSLSGHWAHQSTERFYNGVTKEDIEGENKNSRNGIDRIFAPMMRHTNFGRMEQSGWDCRTRSAR